MTREDFLYALENEGLINCDRDDNNRIDVEETVENDTMKCGCYTRNWEWLSCETIYRILDDLGAFED